MSARWLQILDHCFLFEAWAAGGVAVFSVFVDLTLLHWVVKIPFISTVVKRRQWIMFVRPVSIW